MALQTRQMTAAEFDVFAELPENRDKILEYIGGEVVEPGQPRRLLTLDDTLDGGELLPGFQLSVKAIFPK